MRYFFFLHHVVRKPFLFLTSDNDSYSKNILLYSETVINTVCRGIQVSEQKYVNMSHFSKIKMVS